MRKYYLPNVPYPYTQGRLFWGEASFSQNSILNSTRCISLNNAAMDLEIGLNDSQTSVDAEKGI